jgi:hypothetical protein
MTIPNSATPSDVIVINTTANTIVNDFVIDPICTFLAAKSVSQLFVRLVYLPCLLRTLTNGITMNNT